MLSMQRQGRLGTFALVKGQEAAQVGAVAALEASDWMVPSYRETAASLWRGTPMEGLLLYNAGYNEGGRVPEGQNDLPISIPVASQLLHAAGLAYALKVQGEERVVMTFFGDGATSQGDFHEALNFARVFSCPVVFVCQNNQYAISVPRSHQTKSKTLAQKAFAYDVPCLQVDGNDVLAVYVACKEAVSRARKEQQPTLIECVTYRLSMHTTVDDPSKYRDDEEVEKWAKREPLIRFRQYLENRALLADEDNDELEERLDKRIQESVENAERMMSEAEVAPAIFEHLFSQSPPVLTEQRAEFEAWQRSGKARSEQEKKPDETRRKKKANAENDDGAGAESGAA
jgi:pyruvate dehydrogenase E1 component alpha subunit